MNGLANGAHTFSVRAIDAAGNVDASPASQSFTVNVVTTPPPPDTGACDAAQAQLKSAQGSLSKAKAKLKKAKNQQPDQAAITISAEDGVKYEDLVRVIDTVVSDSTNPLFPSVSVSPASGG